MMFSGTGRTAILSGIANPSARFMLEAGYNVVLCTHSQEQADVMLKKIPAELHDRLMVRFVSIADKDEMTACIRETVERFGGFDVLACGIGALEIGNVAETTPEEFAKTVASHVDGVYACIKHSLPELLKSDSPRIINYTCIDGKCGRFNFGVGSAAGKGALVGMTRAIALEYAGYGLTANCIAVGAMETLRERPQEEIDQLNRAIPLGHIATADDIAPILCFLASREAAYVTGAVINASGGAYMD